MTKEAMKLALELKNSASGYWTEKEISIIEKLIDALAQQAQEPVAWINPDEQNARKAFHWVKAEEFTSPVYTTPPQRKPRTDEQIETIWRRVQANDFYDCVQPFARAIEAELKEKNI